MFKHGDHRHAKVSEARDCEEQKRRKDTIHIGLPSGEGDCAGGVCTSIYDLCSRHQAQYQNTFGRASNE